MNRMLHDTSQALGFDLTQESLGCFERCGAVALALSLLWRCQGATSEDAVLPAVDAWVVLLLAAFATWMLFAARVPPSVLWSLTLGALIAFGLTGIVLVSGLSHGAR